MTNLIQAQSEKKFSMIREEDGSDVRYRLTSFENWLSAAGGNLVSANLKVFRNDMLALNYSPRTVQAMLSTIRERMRELLRDNDFIAMLREGLWQSAPSLSSADLELRLQGLLRQMQNNADPRNSRVRMTQIQDHIDDDGKRLWLNDGRYQELLDRIVLGKAELLAARDQAIIALFLATGIRNAELCSLKVEDLYQSHQGEPSLLVRQGKGNKQRVVIYGDLYKRFMEPYVFPWAGSIGSASAPLFSGFWKGWKKLRPGHIDASTIDRLLQQVSFVENGEEVHVKPHDLRRTYARMLFEEYGMSVTGIQQQMGHVNQKTTLEYIGTIDVAFRTPSKGS